MFINLLKTLEISEEELTPYKGKIPSEFNNSRTKPLGFIELMVTYSGEPLTRTVKTPFLVLPCKSAYNCNSRTKPLGFNSSFGYEVLLPEG